MSRQQYSAKQFQEHINFLKKRTTFLTDVFKEFTFGRINDLQLRYKLDGQMDDYASISILDGKYRYIFGYKKKGETRYTQDSHMSVGLMVPDFIVEEAEMDEIKKWYEHEAKQQIARRSARKLSELLSPLRTMDPEARSKMLDSITDEAFESRDNLMEFCNKFYGVDPK